MNNDEINNEIDNIDNEMNSVEELLLETRKNRQKIALEAKEFSETAYYKAWKKAKNDIERQVELKYTLDSASGPISPEQFHKSREEVNTKIDELRKEFHEIYSSTKINIPKE